MKKEFTYEVLESLKKGDPAGLDSVYKLYHSIIFHYSLRFIQNEAMAKEATADVFITLWRKRTLIDPHKPIQAFLYKIAKDTAFDYLKKIASYEKLKQKYIEKYSAAELRNGEVLLIEKEELAYLRQLVDAMPPKRSQIFKMRYFEGSDNHTIAQQLGISVHTVKVQLARARTQLKKQLSMKEELLLIILSFYLS